MMKKFVVLFAVLMTTVSFGQKHYIGGQIGANLSNVCSDNEILDFNFLPGFSGGINYEYKFSNRIQLGTGILYERKGFVTELSFTNEEGIVIGNGEFQNPFDYVSVPFKFGYSIGNRLSGFLNLGVVPSYLLSAKMKLSSSTDIPELDAYDSVDVTDDMDSFELGALVEVGGNYQLKDRMLLFLSASYQHGLTNLYEYKDGYKLFHHRFNISLGLKYALK